MSGVESFAVKTEERGPGEGEVFCQFKRILQGRNYEGVKKRLVKTVFVPLGD